MSNEQLKMLLDMLQSVSGQGVDAFILWMVMDKLVPVVVFASLALVVAAFAFCRGLRMMSDNNHYTEVRAAIGIAREYYESDAKLHERVMKQLRELNSPKK
jgi:uncharacterized membrane protein